ncbi:hypothetical protein [Xanthocytophaga flava]|uniref:hypothetical protein n=1 Tax=Xanthocytophaga flava TaxID=3048013 RepID=UPI0028D0A175|nr:hypothetical protein [Xanthocytophaga flavus]MDJ1472402.1 hypothetical protein [Xanthocytophaga flavus]
MKTLHTFPTLELNDDLKLKGFRVYEAALCQTGHSMFGRRHFYKIVLSTGKTVITYTDRSSVELDGVCLYFANPHIPYSVDILSGEPGGYACIFTENFIKPLERSEILLQSPLFKADGNPVMVGRNIFRLFYLLATKYKSDRIWLTYLYRVCSSK